MSEIITSPTLSSETPEPRLWISKIIFSDHQSFEFEPNELVLLVGPNNSGKSASLRSLAYMGRQCELPVRKITINQDRTNKEIAAYIRSKSQHFHHSRPPSFISLSCNIPENNLTMYERGEVSGVSVVWPFFTNTHLPGNISITNDQSNIALYDEPPVHPFHQLAVEKKLERKVSEYFKKAFGDDLTIFKTGGRRIFAVVGTRPILRESETEYDERFIRELMATNKKLSAQGEGMRSFAATLLTVAASPHKSIQFIDEPEAFLHPPQARLLGEYICTLRRKETQTFIATHSADVIEGVLASGATDIRIIRLQRSGNNCQSRELPKEAVKAIVTDTLARYSGVIAGIFYRHVIVCESDADCLFYQSILMAEGVAEGGRRPDVLFLHASGKHRMSKVIGTLRPLGVQISAILDIDGLREKDAIKSIFESLGGSWDSVSATWQSVVDAIDQAKPLYDAGEVRAQIEGILKNVPCNGQFPNESEKKIKNIFRSTSPWSELKQSGKRAFRSAQALRNYQAIETKFSEVGLWIVPVGELEGFCRIIEATHGPAFTAKVLENRNLETAPDLEEARTFMRNVWNGALAREYQGVSGSSAAGQSVT